MVIDRNYERDTACSTKVGIGYESTLFSSALKEDRMSWEIPIGNLHEDYINEYEGMYRVIH